MIRSGLLDRAKASALRVLGRKPKPEEALQLEIRKSAKGWRWVVVNREGEAVAEARQHQDTQREAQRAYAGFLIAAPYQRSKA